MSGKTNQDSIRAYLEVLLREGKYDEFVESVGHLARAHGIAAVSSATGLGRESLYKALLKGSKPRFETICKVLGSMGLALSVEPNRER